MIGDMSQKKFLLIKFFDNKDFVESFRKGKLRMMSTKYYKELEKTNKLYNNRYDSLENSHSLYNPNQDGKILFKEPLKFGNEEYPKMRLGNCTVSSPVIISSNTSDEMTKITCMYSILWEDLVDGKLSSCLSTMEDNLGDYYCFVTNLDEFLYRIQIGILKYAEKRIVRNGFIDFVKYVDEFDHNGLYGPFCKPSGLSWQREARIKLETRNVDPFWLDVGSLKDVTIWGKKKDLLNATLDKDKQLRIDNFYR